MIFHRPIEVRSSEVLRGPLALPQELLQVREGLSQLALRAHRIGAVHLVFVPAAQEEGRKGLDVAQALPASRERAEMAWERLENVDAHAFSRVL